MLVKIRKKIRSWIECEDGMAAVESALVFPVLLTLLAGTFDMGRGILSNQKAIRASQVTADLVTRARAVTMADIDEAVEAGEQALKPFPTDSFGVEIISIRFDHDANPEIVWSELRGDISPDTEVLTKVASLAAPDEGVVVVNVEYDFQPVFAGFVVNEISMRETAFARGRKSAVVSLE
ncbi:MAG: pilus assembly protein [Alphaproteobacteria bacterium]|nr:pilus assembly protein [Alphaproteobacteria bacterium]